MEWIPKGLKPKPKPPSQVLLFSLLIASTSSDSAEERSSCLSANRKPAQSFTNFHTCGQQEREKEQRNEKQVLVLGLDGAGKSSVLQVLNGTRRPRGCRPTRGFNFMSIRTPGCQLDFLEIGGGEDLRMYWTEYLRKTHILVYVVDSSDRQRLPLAKEELHRLLTAAEQLPVVVLGNKQDKPDAVSVSELHDALSLETIRDERRVFLLTAQLGSEGLNESGGLRAFQDLLLQLV